MFPYPSGEGLHAGHAFASSGSDIYGRFMRMQGKTVFQPIGYDSFGIHTENFALKVGEHPAKLLAKTTKHYQEQLKSMGHGYDWTRTVTTSDIDYYVWTQWLFTELFKAGLAYKAKAEVNWCPSCKTVLADEQVISGVCERCKTQVTKKELEQWFFRIKDYAERLLDNLKKIDWSNRVKLAQANWIGKSSGAKIKFAIKGKSSKNYLEVFTTRPDTLNGATFIVVSPDSPLAIKLTTKENKDNVSKYIEVAQKKPDADVSRQKTGVFTGSYAVNPLTKKEIPIWVSEYVLATYGMGVIMGVPEHDERDREFAEKYGMEIARKAPDASLWDRIEKEGWGGKFTNYHLRDWLISRQRYWGPPIPMIFCASCKESGKSYLTKNKPNLRADQSDWDHLGWYPVEEKDLPVALPKVENYQPTGTGVSPLAQIESFVKVGCPGCGGEAVRETDVSDTFLDSAWYFLRYPSLGSKTEAKLPFDPEITKKWLPVDFYFGGAEHSVLHLMYARFITMVLYDLKRVHFEEPFPKLFAHGLMIKEGAKMSKSRGNVVNPDAYIEKFGADALRLYLVFIGPMDASPDFRDTGMQGMKKFVERIWKLFAEHKESGLSPEDEKEVTIKMHQTIKKVTEDIQIYHYNTALSSLMELTNLLYSKLKSAKKGSHAVWNQALLNLTKMLAPFAPHLAEEIWVNVLGQKFSVHLSNWPAYKPEFVKEEEITLVVQVDARLRGQLRLNEAQSRDQKVVEELAKKDSKVASWLGGKKVKKTIFVPGKLINFVLQAD
jgi:leucyl-tRNA synthetase